MPLPASACAALLAVVLTAGVSAAAPASADTADRAAICGGRKTCEVGQLWPAGLTASGQRLTVARALLGLADKPKGAAEEGCRTDAENNGGEEYWLLRGGAAPRRLLALCNDGYGVGVGQDTITVGPNALTHEQYGGSAWRWTATTLYQLDPLAIRRQSVCRFHATAGAASARVFDAGRFAGWSYVPTKPSPDTELGCPAFPAAGGPGGRDTITARTLIAPGLSGPLAGLPTATRLGGCALRLSTGEGPLAFGAPAGKGQAAEIRVVAQRDGRGTTTLLAQVSDPAAGLPSTRPERSWIDRPHIELWMGREERDSDSPESGRNLDGLTQFAVLPDGKVERGAGTDWSPPEVTRVDLPAQGGRPAVSSFRIAFPSSDAAGWTIAYSQAVNGRQARLVSAVPMERGRPRALPWISAPDAPCRLVDGALEPGPWLPNPNSGDP